MKVGNGEEWTIQGYDWGDAGTRGGSTGLERWAWGSLPEVEMRQHRPRGNNQHKRQNQQSAPVLQGGGAVLTQREAVWNPKRIRLVLAVNATSVAARDERVARGGKAENKRRSSNGSILVFVPATCAFSCCCCCLCSSIFMSTGHQPYYVPVPACCCCKHCRPGTASWK